MGQGSNVTRDPQKQPSNPMSSASGVLSSYKGGQNLANGAQYLYDSFMMPSSVDTIATGMGAPANAASFMAGNAAVSPLSAQAAPGTAEAIGQAGASLYNAPSVGSALYGGGTALDGASIMGGTAAADAAAGAEAVGAGSALSSASSLLGPIGLGAAGIYGLGSLLDWW